MTDQTPDTSKFTTTSRYLCPLPGCDWTLDHEGPPNAETEAHLAAHVKAHRGEDWLREVMRLRAALEQIVGESANWATRIAREALAGFVPCEKCNGLIHPMEVEAHMAKWHG